MFRPATIQSLVALLILSVVTRTTLLALICTLLLVTAALAWVWNRWSLARVSCEHELSQRQALPGDEIDLYIRVTNRKLLPIPALYVHDKVAAGLKVIGPHVTSDRNGGQFIRRVTSLRWYEGVVWHYRVQCLARGSYQFGPTNLTSGDPFGFHLSDKEITTITQLIVYPRFLSLDELGLPPRHPLGMIRAHHLIRDPLRTVGVRDYHPEDPLKDIHWTATARTGSLQTRIYEPTTSLEVAIFLDISIFEEYWLGVDSEQVERLISATATVAQAGLAEGYAVGLYVNGMPGQYEHLIRLLPGRNPAQLEYIMATLARLKPYAATSMARLLRDAVHDLSWNTSLLLVSAIAPEKTCAALTYLHSKGRHVSWLYLGSGTTPKLPGITVHQTLPKQKHSEDVEMAVEEHQP